MHNIAKLAVNMFYTNLSFVSIKKLEELKNIRYYARNYKDLWPNRSQCLIFCSAFDKFISVFLSQSQASTEVTSSKEDYTDMFRRPTASLTSDHIYSLSSIIQHQGTKDNPAPLTILSLKNTFSANCESLSFCEILVQSLLSHLGEVCADILAADEALIIAQPSLCPELDTVKIIFSELCPLIKIHLAFFYSRDSPHLQASLFFIYLSTMWELQNQLEDTHRPVSNILATLTLESVAEVVAFIRVLASIRQLDIYPQDSILLQHIIKDLFEVKAEGYTVAKRPGTTRKAPPKFSFTSKKPNMILTDDTSEFSLAELNKKSYLIEKEDLAKKCDSFQIDSDKFRRFLKDHSILEFEKSRLYCERFCLDLVQLRSEFFDHCVSLRTELFQRPDIRLAGAKTEESPYARLARLKVNRS